MRAVVHDRYGPPEVLRIEEVERPVPKDDEVLVRVRASTVTQTDCHMRRARPLIWRFMLGLLRPKRRILGSELAGEVEAVGTAVTPSRWANASLPLALLTSRSKRKVVFATDWRPPRENILLLKELVEAGKYRAVVDRTYPLEDVVEATRYVDTWQKTGNVVLTVDGRRT
jgi:NADPH:quinone reductase-like Zn-dependent oxidoreductase